MEAMKKFRIRDLASEDVVLDRVDFDHWLVRSGEVLAGPGPAGLEVGQHCVMFTLEVIE